MDQDTYVEWLVKRKDPVYAWPARIALGILCAVSLLLAFATVWGILLFGAVGAATYFLFQMLSVEYEYLYVDGGLTVDKILGRSRRKKLLECTKDQLIMVAPSDHYVLKDHESNGMRVYDCSSADRSRKTHTLIYQEGSQRVKVIFEPNDKMLQAIRHTSPRKIVL